MFVAGVTFSEFETGLFWGLISGIGIGAVLMFVACMIWALRAMEERS